jgi:hypothetical protein
MSAPSEDIELSSDDEEEPLVVPDSDSEDEEVEVEFPDDEEEEEEEEEDEDEDEDEEEDEDGEQLGFLSRFPILPVIMVLMAIGGLMLHRGNDYSARAQQVVNSPYVFGIILMLHSFYGSKGITEPPALFASISKSRFMKIFTLLLVGFVATRDLEDTLFATIMFLGLTQLFRTPAERAKHPAIL